MNNQGTQNDKHGMLESTAQAIGSTLGSIAVKTGLAKPTATAETSEPVTAASKTGQTHLNRKARRAKKKK